MNVRIEKRRDVKKVVDIFECCAVLHNLLIGYGDEGEDFWYENTFDDVGGYEGENDDVNDVLPQNANGNTRRNRIYYNMLDQYNMNLDV